MLFGPFLNILSHLITLTFGAGLSQKDMIYVSDSWSSNTGFFDKKDGLLYLNV